MEDEVFSNEPKKNKTVVGRTVSIKVTEERLEDIKSKVHVEFKKVTIPIQKQNKLRCGDTIYVRTPSGKSLPLEFLDMDTSPGYNESQVDIIAHVI